MKIADFQYILRQDRYLKTVFKGKLILIIKIKIIIMQNIKE